MVKMENSLRICIRKLSWTEINDCSSITWKNYKCHAPVPPHHATIPYVASSQTYIETLAGQRIAGMGNGVWLDWLGSGCGLREGRRRGLASAAALVRSYYYFMVASSYAYYNHKYAPAAGQPTKAPPTHSPAGSVRAAAEAATTKQSMWIIFCACFNASSYLYYSSKQ